MSDVKADVSAIKLQWVEFLSEALRTKVMDQEAAKSFAERKTIDLDEVLQLKAPYGEESTWGLTLLMVCAHLSVDDAAWALELGCSVNVTDPTTNFDALSYALDGDVVDAARLLVTKGANLHNVTVRNGNSVLHQAVHYGSDDDASVQFIQLLVMAGADLSAKDRHGKTALQSLLYSDRKRPKVAEFLATGADQLAKSRSQAAGPRHVMISYQWGHQKTILRLKEALQAAGIPVWLDVEKMSGSVPAAMADAVENASIVLLCMSSQYEKSANCRLEGEYALTLRKQLIPLKLAEGYTPRGWLGLAVGAKLYYNLSKPDKFDAELQRLIKEIQTTLDTERNSNTKIQAPASQVNTNKPKCNKTAAPAVVKWLAECGLPSFVEQAGRMNIDERALEELRWLKVHEPGEYKAAVREWAPRASLGERLRLGYALRLVWQEKKK